MVTSHECSGDLNHRRCDCLFNSLVWLTTKGNISAFPIKSIANKISKSKFCIIGPFWGESTGHRWIALAKCQWYGIHFMLLCPRVKHSTSCDVTLRFHLCGRSFSVVLPSLSVDQRQRRSGPDALRRQRNRTLCLHRAHHQHLWRSMMTSSNGNFSDLLAPCAGNSLVTGEFLSQRPVTWSFDVFSLICLICLILSINARVNNLEAGDLRRHRTHYDVTVRETLAVITFHLLAILIHCPLGDFNEMQISNLKANFILWWLRYDEITLRWLSLYLTGEMSQIGSGNGLVPPGNKPLPEPMLTQNCVAKWRHWVTISQQIEVWTKLLSFCRRHFEEQHTQRKKYIEKISLQFVPRRSTDSIWFGYL